jgi:hypothetical protein
LPLTLAESLLGATQRFTNDAIKEPHALAEALKKCKTIADVYRSIHLYREFKSQGISDSMISGLLALPGSEQANSEPASTPAASNSPKTTNANQSATPQQLPYATPNQLQFTKPKTIAIETPPHDWIHSSPAPLPTPQKSPGIILGLPDGVRPYWERSAKQKAKSDATTGVNTLNKD